MTDTVPPKNPMLRVLGLRDFRLLWIGGSISVLGSQFSMIAMPWLVLQITDDPLALAGAVTRWSLTALFVTAGGLILLTALWSFLQPELKSLSREVVAREPA